MNMMRTGSQWLNDKLKASASESATYSRGGSSVTGGLAVTAGETRFEQLTEEGLTVEARIRDFTFEAADLVILGTTVLPAKGDRIVFGSTTYEVLPVSGGEEQRYCDRFDIRLRVHTKEIAVS